MARDYPRSEILDIIEREANERGIPRDDFLRFAYIETGGGFDETVNRGPNGAKGLFQFVPGTARAYGIEGRELDPIANTDAAAQLYLDNRRILMNRQANDGVPYLSGKDQPDGFDMYMAHQQGAAGYRSIQTAIQTGEFARSDTRSNILNNVSSRDLEAVTGVEYATFRNMSDRDLAQTFTRYWDTKFDRISIPEKGIEPLTAETGARTQQPTAQQPSAQQPAEQAAAGIALEKAHALTLQYDHVKYGLGAKNPDSGKVDCSGWVVALQNATMEEINTKAGRDVFSKSERFSPGYDGAAMIVDKAQQRSGVLLEGKAVTADALREGMIIGEDNGPKSWDAGRYKGIDHIVMVVRDPTDGQLKVSQSRGGEGVELSSLDAYLSNKQSRGVKLFATDPLHNARELLQDKAVVRGNDAPVQSGAQEARATNTVLRENMRGEEVKQLQASLARMGYGDAEGRPLVADGAFGARTAAALKEFQRDHGLQVDGVAGPKTFEALRAAEKVPLISDPTHPQHPLFQQSRERLQQLSPAPYGNARELDNAAGALAFQARANGLERIDHIVPSRDGNSLFAVQGALDDPAHRRVHADNERLAEQTLVQSSSRMQQMDNETIQTQQQDQQRRSMQMA